MEIKEREGGCLFVGQGRRKVIKGEVQSISQFVNSTLSPFYILSHHLPETQTLTFSRLNLSIYIYITS